MMDLPRKGPVYNRSDKLSRRLRAIGVPSRYWNIDDVSTFRDRCRGIQIERKWHDKIKQVTKAQQERLIQRLLCEYTIGEESGVLGVGASPTDDYAMRFGSMLVRRALELRLRPLMVDCRHYATEHVNHEVDVLLLHNLPTDCLTIRAQVCRDWLTRFDDVFRVVIVAGADPVTFFYNRLYHPVDYSLYFQGDQDGEDL